MEFLTSIVQLGPWPAPYKENSIPAFTPTAVTLRSTTATGAGPGVVEAPSPMELTPVARQTLSRTTAEAPTTQATAPEKLVETTTRSTVEATCTKSGWLLVVLVIVRSRTVAA